MSWVSDLNLLFGSIDTSDEVHGLDTVEVVNLNLVVDSSLHTLILKSVVSVTDVFEASLLSNSVSRSSLSNEDVEACCILNLILATWWNLSVVLPIKSNHGHLVNVRFNVELERLGFNWC